MIRKQTAFILVLIASFLYLAHAVIPHHHHAEHICFDLFHHARHSEDHNCDKDSEHPSDNKSEREDCVIKDEVILPSKEIKEKLSYLEVSENLPDFFNSSFVNVGTLDVFKGSLEYSTRFHYVIANCYESSIPGLNGLRAPPLAV